MNRMLKKLAIACTSTMLLACAGTGENPSSGRAQGPMLSDHPDELPAARNRRATELAEHGDYAPAIATWRELTVSAHGPESAYLFRNLGYALYLNHDYDGALTALEKACLLDPLNARGWRHLGEALQKLGQEERAQLMLRQADALQQHDFKNDYALARAASVPAIATAVAAPERVEEDLSAIKVIDASGGLVDLRTGTPSAPPADSAPVQPKPPTRLEISNGNGVKGMARATAHELDDRTIRVVRLTNQKPFNVQYTRVEYEVGFEEAASRLAERFGKAAMVKVEQCKSGDVRLVIGKDLVHAQRTAKSAKATAWTIK